MDGNADIDGFVASNRSASFLKMVMSEAARGLSDDSADSGIAAADDAAESFIEEGIDEMNDNNFKLDVVTPGMSPSLRLAPANISLKEDYAVRFATELVQNQEEEEEEEEEEDWKAGPFRRLMPQDPYGESEEKKVEGEEEEVHAQEEEVQAQEEEEHAREEGGGEEQEANEEETSNSSYHGDSNDSRWAKLWILSTMMRPFKRKLDSPAASPRLRGGLSNNRNSILTKFGSILSTKAKQTEERKELQNSTMQFRNPAFEFCSKAAIGASKRRKGSFFYAAKKRPGLRSVVPIIGMDFEESTDNSSTLRVTPEKKRKPENMSDWVLDIDSGLYQHFYLLLVFLVLMMACSLPFQFVFSERGGTIPAPTGAKVLNCVINVVYIIDFLLSFHLTYVNKKGETVTDLSMISEHYMSSHSFKVDLLSAIPFDFVCLFTEALWWGSYIKLVKTARLLSLMNLRRLSDNQTVVNVGRIVWVMVLFVIATHIMACAWFQISLYEEKYLPNNHSWMKNKMVSILKEQLSDQQEEADTDDSMKLHEYTCQDGGVSFVSGNECFTVFRQYLLSFYVVMLILVQDSVDPTTEIECLFAIIFGLFGMVVAAILVGQTADIVASLHRSESRFRSKLDDVTEQLKNLEINSRTRKRVFEYLDYMWDINKGLNRESILGELSDNLRREVLVSVHGDVIRKIPFFDCDKIPELLIHLVGLLKSSYYLPGDVIVHEHEKTVDSSCMYFIVHGSVAVYHMKRPESILHVMGKGDCFGEYAFIARGSRRTASVCAATNADVDSLMFSDVDKLTKVFPEMKGQMEKELKTQMAFTGECDVCACLLYFILIIFLFFLWFCFQRVS